MQNKKVVLIVAHPDDETLWAGGTILCNPSWQLYVICLSRCNDKDRAPKFYRALNMLNAHGNMGNLDDGSEQKPLDNFIVQKIILDLIPKFNFDLIITHNPSGEYTKHLRHEETSNAVIELWNTNKISANELWTFAYEDNNKQYYPKPIATASIINTFSKSIWLKKYSIIRKIYGFAATSFEAKTTPRSEAFFIINKK